ncbi:MAG: GTPase HflX [Armatimonadota bacterium]|nr:GTPase HflX [Armatimonadota bacterium]
MLEALSRRRVPQERIASPELLSILAHLAQALRREVGVFVDRHGVVGPVVISRRWQPLVDEAARRSSRDAGLRYVEVHPQPDGRPDEGDQRVLTDLALDLVVTAGVERGAPTEVWLLTPTAADGDSAWVTEGPYSPDALAHLDLAPRVRAAIAARRRRGPVPTGSALQERAVLVALDRRGDAERSLEELARLAETAGAQPVATIIQRRATPDPATYIGRGKLDEIVRAGERYAATVVLVDEELTPAQQRTLERELGMKVLDRTALVLDIFAQRARTREGRLQVELAQLEYTLPRLAGRGVWLSRLGGGIGTRGPGETKLEMDRRRIRQRITHLRREIDLIRRRRARQRAPRQRAGVPQVALVGYTNAGKSTLLNALTGAQVFVEDRLFATLDPTARRLVLPTGRQVVLVDTVGFIQRLPTQLVAAFRATLEEVTAADLLVHVVDASRPDWPAQVEVVHDVLAEIGAGDHPRVLVFNKADLLDEAAVRALAQAQPEAIVISATRRQGLDRLLDALARHLPEPWLRVRLRIPYRDARLLAQIHREGRVVAEHYDGEGAVVVADLPGPVAVQLRALSATGEARRSPSPR